MSNYKLPQLAPREPDSHKGTYGTAMLIGGAQGTAGAIALAGMASLRGGAGLTRLIVPQSCLDTIASYEPCYMTSPLPCDSDGRIAVLGEAIEEVVAVTEPAKAVALGPGLGRSDMLDPFIAALYREIPKPMVVDADALNALAAGLEDAPKLLSTHAGPRILTPHPGEMARLIGRKLDREEQISAAREMAKDHEIVLVLKGHGTLVTDGSREYVNTTGNPGMATGGSGDILTGLVTALLCQDLSPFDAACLGVYLHGLAGDLAAESVGETSLIATDLIDHLPDAILEYQETSNT